MNTTVKKTLMLIIAMTTMMIPGVSQAAGEFAGFINANTKAAEWFIRIAFGGFGAYLVWDLIDAFVNAKDQGALKTKVFGGIICGAFCAMPSLLTGFITKIGF